MTPADLEVLAHQRMPFGQYQCASSADLLASCVA